MVAKSYIFMVSALNVLPEPNVIKRLLEAKLAMM